MKNRPRWMLACLFLLSPRLAFADEIKALNHGDQSFAAYYQSIQNAKQSIDLATYMMEPCQSIPKILLTALTEKAKNGVKVRFAIETWNMTEPNKSNLQNWVASQSQKNMEIRYYGSTFLFEGDRSRSHMKMFIVDGKGNSGTTIVGGRNWTDEYFGINPKMNYIDQDLLITGSSVAAVESGFERLWNASAASSPSGDGAEWAKTCMAITALDNSVAQFIQTNAASILQSRPARSCNRITYAADDPDFLSQRGAADSHSAGEILNSSALREKYATQLWLNYLSGTQSKIAMVNQYYMPLERVRTALDGLRTEKKNIEIIANATGDIDNPLQNANFTCWMQNLNFQTSNGSQKVEMLTSHGALSDPWALSVKGTPWRIHAKTGIRDGADVLVGSWNMDPRSYATNLEDAVLIEGCPDLAADVNEEYDLLRAALSADAACKTCQQDLLPANFSNSVFCGGLPTLY